MEITQGLLSNLVQTKSIERVLAPISSQVSQLIILNEAYEKGDRLALQGDFQSFANSVMKASEGLIDVAQKMASESDEQELQISMPRACETLGISSRDMIVATQRLRMEDFSRESRRQLVRTAKVVLEGTMKVLLVADDSEVRKIVKAAQMSIERLALLSSVKTMDTLLLCFKSFTESTMVLTKLTDKRQKELTHPRQRERIITSMTLLKKSVPMLSTSLQTYVKYIGNPQAQVSKEHVIGEVLTAIQEIIAAVKNQQPDEDVEEIDEPGSFVTKLDKILNELSSEGKVTLSDDLEMMLEVIIRHSMAVAHLSSENHRDLILKNCQRLLRQKSEVAKHSKNVQENPTFAELRAEFDESCERLSDEFQDLERHVNAAVLQQIVDVFKETTEPLERMMKAALAPSLELRPLPEDRCVFVLEPYKEAFDLHSDGMYQMAKFAAASSTESRRVRVIIGCVKHMEALDTELYPAILACARDRQDRGSLEQLKLLRTEWCHEVETLVSTLDEITDTPAFLLVTETRLQEDLQEIKDTMFSQETSSLARLVKSVVGRARRCVQVGTTMVDKSHDPIYRNGLMVYINKLEKGIPGVKSAARQVLEDMTNARAHNKLQDRCARLIENARKVRLAFDSSTHPELFSPLRDNVRPLKGIRKVVPKEPLLSAQLCFDDEEEEKEVKKEPSRHAHSSPLRGPSLNPVALNSPNSFLGTDVMSSSPKAKSPHPASYEGEQGAPSCDLQRVTRELISTAMAADKTRVDLLSNTVLERASHVIEIANAIAGASNDTLQKESFQRLSSAVTHCTPQLIDQARKVCRNQVEEIDPLHHSAQDWAAKVSELQTAIDVSISPWKKVVDKMTDSAHLKNLRLFKLEMQHMEEHKDLLRSLVGKVADSADPSNLFTIQLAQLLRDYSDELENLTATAITMADVMMKSGSSEGKDQVEITAREWAAKVFCICSSIDSMGKSAVAEFVQLEPTPDRAASGLQSSHMLREETQQFTTFTLRLVDLANSALLGCENQSLKERCQYLLRDLEKLNEEITDAANALRCSPAMFPAVVRIYAPQTLRSLQCQWANRAKTLTAVLEDMTSDLCKAVERLVSSAKSVARCLDSTSPLTTVHAEYEVVSEQFNARFMKAKERALDAIQLSGDLDRKGTVRQGLDDLNRLTTALLLMAKQIADGADPEPSEIQRAKLQWASKAQLIITTLKLLPDGDYKAIQDVTNQLRAVPPSSTPRRSERETMTDLMVSLDSTGLSDSTFTMVTPITMTTSALQTPQKQNSQGVTPKKLFAAPHTQQSPKFTGTPSSSTFRTTGHLKKPSGHVRFRKSSPPPRGVLDEMREVFKMGSDGHPCEDGQKPSAIKAKSQSQMGRETPTAKALAAAALSLQQEADKWEDDNNAIVKVAKEMSSQMYHMAGYIRGQGPIKSRDELIDTAKAIAKNGETIVKFAKLLGQYCADKRFVGDLLFHADHIPTLSTQLSIIASVKAATPDDKSAEKMLVQNADNLMEAVIKTMTAAESACAKGMQAPASTADLDETSAIVLAIRWRKKFSRHQQQAKQQVEYDELGLRKVNPLKDSPTLSHIFARR